MIKNIKVLTMAGIKGYIEKYQLLNERGKINFKSIYVVMFILFSVTLFFLSQYIIGELVRKNQEDLFINIYFGIISIILIFQTIVSGINIMYFSKDIEQLLPLPIKPIELLTSKMIISVIQLITFELIVLIFPMFLYGLYSDASIIYYILTPIILILYPICLVLINTIINLFIINLIKIIKKREIFQIVSTMIVLALIVIVEIAMIYFSLKNENKLNTVDLNLIFEKYHQVNIMNNTSMNIFKGENEITSIFTIIGLNILLYLTICVFGKKYINKILYTTKYTKKIKKFILTTNKCKRKNKNIAYLKNEFTKIIKNPIFLIQLLLPIISMQFVIIGIGQALNVALKNNANGIAEEFAKLPFNMEGIIYSLIVYQILIFFTGISLTSISRMGKEAIIMKVIPIKLYTQFIIKNIPEVLINIIISIIYIVLLKNIFTTVDNKYYILGIIYMLLINIINSNILTYIDLMKPNLNWTNEHEIFTHNNNKIIQYALLIIECAVLWYIAGVLKDKDIAKSLIVFIGILLTILIGINIYIKKNIGKIFNKII